MQEIKNKKFISLLSDTTFKYLVKEERFRPFINRAIYLITGIDIKDYYLVDSELNNGNQVKDYRLDILLANGNNLINIEMNRFPSDYQSKKNHQYLYRLAGSGYLKGEAYKDKWVTQINFNQGEFKENENVGIIIYEFQNIEYQQKIEGIKDYEIYLGKYKGICYTKEKEKEAILSFFNSESYGEMKEIAKGNKEMEKIEEELERLGVNDEWNAIYDAEIVQKKLENSARELGYEEGIAQEKKEIALSMMKNQESIEKIEKYTGLTAEEIENLKEKP